ncbi:MFS transporter [Nocardia beijingensis]|uniref:MFS transporter n=1 Tax=Nocardia beijingensis TaxID=95162 RepID=UPI00331E8E4C
MGQLLVRRGLSGLSAGIFTGAATATIIEVAPPSWKDRAMVAAAIANVGGLGLGHALSGMLVQYGRWPLHLAFALHLALIAAAVLAVKDLEEPVGLLTAVIPTFLNQIFGMHNKASSVFSWPRCSWRRHGLMPSRGELRFSTP